MVNQINAANLNKSDLTLPTYNLPKTKLSTQSKPKPKLTSNNLNLQRNKKVRTSHDDILKKILAAPVATAHAIPAKAVTLFLSIFSYYKNNFQEMLIPTYNEMCNGFPHESILIFL